MTHLAWIAVDSFRPTVSGLDTPADISIAVTSLSLEVALHDRSAIIAPGESAWLLRGLANPFDQERFDRSGLWEEMTARSVSAASFDRAIAMRLRSLGTTNAAPLLPIMTQLERSVVATHFPELSQLLAPTAVDATSFRVLASTFLVTPGVEAAGPAGPTATDRMRASMQDLVATVRSIQSLKEVATS